MLWTSTTQHSGRIIRPWRSSLYLSDSLCMFIHSLCFLLMHTFTQKIPQCATKKERYALPALPMDQKDLLKKTSSFQDVAIKIMV